jgi:hypothetical protein
MQGKITSDAKLNSIFGGLYGQFGHDGQDRPLCSYQANSLSVGYLATQILQRI